MIFNFNNILFGGKVYPYLKIIVQKRYVERYFYTQTKNDLYYSTISQNLITTNQIESEKYC